MRVLASRLGAHGLLARLTAEYGRQVADHEGGLTRLFPMPESLVDLGLTRLGLMDGRWAPMATLIRALADGILDLNAGSDWARARRGLLGCPGFTPRMVETVAMRALGDPDAFAPTHAATRAAAARLGLLGGLAELASRAEGWRPWRAYGVEYLLAAGGSNSATFTRSASKDAN
jgi:AraC family transcriptional regulator of adaptative response / DNA-3-methyladenine glycosylase II